MCIGGVLVFPIHSGIGKKEDEMELRKKKILFHFFMGVDGGGLEKRKETRKSIRVGALRRLALKYHPPGTEWKE